MQLKLRVSKCNKKVKNKLTVWIQRNKIFETDMLQVLKFFKDQIQVFKIRRFLPYFKITSDNPAIIISLYSTLLELIPEIFFNEENNIGSEEALNSV
jgi:chromatin segregation and condensation protein Rec8/ScpA/Scc1 (kleisin family)